MAQELAGANKCEGASGAKLEDSCLMVAFVMLLAQQNGTKPAGCGMEHLENHGCLKQQH